MRKDLIAMLVLSGSSLLATTGCGDETMGVDGGAHSVQVEAKNARVGPYRSPSALDTEVFQDYVVEVLDFARLAYGRAPARLPVHGVMHAWHPEWSTGKWRVYRKALPGSPATVSYVVSAEGSNDLGDFLRDAQAVIARLPTTNPLTGDPGGRLASGFAALVRNYMTGRVGGDAFTGFLDDVEQQLERGTRVEMVVTGHSLGAAAAYIFSWYMWQYLEEAWPDAQVHIRNFAFAAPKTMSPLLARDFSEAVRSGGRGPFRLQSYTFTRSGDLVTYGGSPLVHHPMWAPNQEDGWVNRDLRFFGRRLRRNIGHCSHVNLPARVGPIRPVSFVLENHHYDLFHADLADHDTWHDMAECMARPDRGADRPGFKTFWGP